MKAALLHVLGDLIQSSSVLLAAGILWAKPSWHLVDPTCTFLFSILILYTSIPLFKQIYSVLAEKSPDRQLVSAILNYFESLSEVNSVQDLHIWTITPGKVALSAHLFTEDNFSAKNCEHDLKIRYSIHHCTLQVNHRR